MRIASTASGSTASTWAGPTRRPNASCRPRRLGRGPGWIAEAERRPPLRPPGGRRGGRQPRRLPALRRLRADDRRADRPGAMGGGGEPVSARRSRPDARPGAARHGCRPRCSGPATTAPRSRVGMAHIGVGAFHRCHQAEYTDDLLASRFDRWGVVGINIRPPRLADTLGRQDGLYTRLHPRRRPRRGPRHRLHRSPSSTARTAPSRRSPCSPRPTSMSSP